MRPSGAPDSNAKLIRLVAFCMFASGALLSGACHQAASKQPQVVGEVPANPRFPNTRFPLLEVKKDFDAVERLMADPVGSQPWMRGPRKPPVSLRELGFKGKPSLVCFEGGQREWGTVVVLSDRSGNLFAFCTSQVRIGESDEFVDAYFIGGLRPSKHLVRVDEWSPSYRFLFSLVWSFAKDKQYQPSSTTLAKARAHANLSESEFAELLKEPALPEPAPPR
jgi:hypothetical protein